MGIPGAVTNFFTVPMIKKLGSSKRLLVVAEIANFSTRILAFAIGTNERYKQLSFLIIALTVVGSAQIFTNMKGIAERSLLTNAVDEMELKTGERTEGITFSMQNFVSKLTPPALLPRECPKLLFCPQRSRDLYTQSGYSSHLREREA